MTEDVDGWVVGTSTVLKDANRNLSGNVRIEGRRNLPLSN